MNNKFLKNIGDEEFTILKAIEELNELAEALTKSLTKRSVKFPNQDIVDEMGDVWVRTYYLKELCIKHDPDFVEKYSKRVSEKFKLIRNYKKEQTKVF